MHRHLLAILPGWECQQLFNRVRDLIVGLSDQRDIAREFEVEVGVVLDGSFADRLCSRVAHE